MASFAPIPIRSVFDRVTRGAGYDPATVNYSAAERERVADLVNDALALAWRRAMWPALMEVRRIAYRPLWEEGAYAEGDEVYHSGHYWRCLSPTSLAPTSSSPDWQCDPPDFLPSFPFVANAIDEVDLEACVYAAHPARSRDPRPYPCRRTDWGAVVASDDYPLLPFVRYRPLPPRYTWANTTPSDTPGAVWFDEATGECMARLPDGSAAALPFPVMFLGFVVRYASACRLRDEDGRAEALSEAWAELDRAQDAAEEGVRAPRRAAARFTQRRTRP